jgi:phage-related protein
LENKRVEKFVPEREGRREGKWAPPIMYTHVNKCKNDKIKFKSK